MKARAKRQQLARFLEMEAELGSDNEENDDVKRKINRDSEEEDEDGMDSDLEGLVDDAPLGDDEEIEAANQAMYERHRQQADEDDERQEEQIIKELIFGPNRKRKRGDVDLEDLDEASKRKMRRIEERFNLNAS